MRTVMSCGGHEAGVATAAPVIEPQWPALSTVSGAISVPVHRKPPNVIWATDGYSPGAVSVPPTTADDGAAVTASSAQAHASATRVLLKVRPPLIPCGTGAARVRGCPFLIPICAENGASRQAGRVAGPLCRPAHQR